MTFSRFVNELGRCHGDDQGYLPQDHLISRGRPWLSLPASAA